MSDQEENESVGGYWPSVTDLFMTLFIIAIVILGAVFFVLLPKNNIAALEQVQFAIGKDLNNVIQPVNRLRAEMGLEPVSYRGASQAIRDLKTTIDSAIELLNELRKNDPTGMAQKIQELESQILELENTIKMLREQLDQSDNPADIDGLKERIARLELENRILKEESRTFVIDERRQEFRFDSGSPVIKQEFARALRSNLGDRADPAPFPDFAARIIKSPDRFNTLEIIGHTDGVPLTRSGNIDQRLPYTLAGESADPLKLTPGSNNDLGLLRSLALKQEWREYVESYIPVEQRDLLRKIEIRCYSAGQTILPVRINNPKPADFTNNDPRARRIEMRLTRLNHGDVEPNDGADEDQ